MIPFFRDFFRRLFFDKDAFTLWTRALLMALANGGMMYSDTLSEITGISDKILALSFAIMSGFALMFPAGDKTSVEKVTDAIMKATPENLAHAIAHREDVPPQAPTP